MKKKLAVSISLAAIIASSFAFGVYAASDIKLIINGKNVATDIQIIDGSSYVPLRVVSESLGADVKWDGDSRTITINGTGAAAAPRADVKTFDVNVTIESGPMVMKITKVTLDPAYKKDKYSREINAIALDVSVENTTDNTVIWYPSQGKIALNTKEQVDSGLFNSDNVDGEFIGKIVKSGKIVFEAKSNLSDVTSLNYVIGGAYSKATYSRIGQDKTTQIILK